MNDILDQIDKEAYHDSIGHGIIGFEYVRAIIGSQEKRISELEKKLAAREWLPIEKAERGEPYLILTHDGQYRTCIWWDGGWIDGVTGDGLNPKLFLEIPLEPESETYCSLCGGDTGHEDWCLGDESGDTGGLLTDNGDGTFDIEGGTFVFPDGTKRTFEAKKNVSVTPAIPCDFIDIESEKS